MFTELEMKLWRLALNKAAMKGEYENAFRMIGESLRERNFTPEDLGIPTIKPIDWGSTIIPLKKHKGKTIREVAITEPDYLAWCIRWIQNGDEDLQDKFKYLVMAINKFYSEGQK
jgi:hypothetical protein